MRAWWRSALLVALLSASAAGAAEHLVTLPTREGVTQSFLLSSPAIQPAAVAVLFPGGPGSIRLRTENGQIKFSPGNFVVRARGFFAGRGIAAAVIDAPSDQQDGMANQFRRSDSHVNDIRAVVADLKKRFPDIPVFLVGTSMGTVSAAYAGRALATEVAGVILTSTVFVPSGRHSKHGDGNLSGFDYAAIPVPLLFVHHAEDACYMTPYPEANRQAAHYPLITVHGGDPPKSDPCEAFSAHGYLGKERETVEAIVNWMLKKPYRDNID